MAAIGGDHSATISCVSRRRPAQPDLTGRTGRPIEPIWILLAMALLSWTLVLGVVSLLNHLL